MDPNICYHNWLYALDHDDFEAANEYRNELLYWLSRKGFEPKWTEEEKQFFLDWRKNAPLHR